MVYWFRENNQIQPISPLFSKYGGYGWECLNERATIKVEEDGQEVFNFNSFKRKIRRRFENSERAWL